MLTKLVPGILLAALPSCGAKDHAAQKPAGASIMEHATAAKISLTSEAFRNGQPIPVQYTCDGGDQSPTLHWGDPPTGSRSFTLVIDDPDAPSGTFRHWGVFDIPASARSIGGGQRIGTEVTNDFGKPGYSGPCPPKGVGPHHYHFKLFALDVDRLNLSPNSKVLKVESESAKHAIGHAELVGTYERR